MLTGEVVVFVMGWIVLVELLGCVKMGLPKLLCCVLGSKEPLSSGALECSGRSQLLAEEFAGCVASPR